MTRTYIYSPETVGLRLAQGNESGANPYWVPGGYKFKTSGGAGLPEIVINQIPSPLVNKKVKVFP